MGLLRIVFCPVFVPAVIPFVCRASCSRFKVSSFAVGIQRQWLAAKAAVAITVTEKACHKLSSPAAEIRNNDDDDKSSQLAKLLETECGLSQANLRNLRKRHPKVFQVRSLRRAKEVLELLRDYGFAVAQIRVLVLQNPAVLRNRAYETLRPKLDLIKSLGFSRGDLGGAVSRGPRLLNVKQLSRNITFFENILEGRENLLKAFRKDPTILTCDPLRADRQVEFLQSLGFAKDDILRLISMTPLVLLRSEDKIGKVMKYLTGVAGLSPAAVVKYPMILGLSLEKRIQPRHKVFLFLAGVPLERPRRLPSLERFITISERNFFKVFVMKKVYEAELLQIYRDCSSEASWGTES